MNADSGGANPGTITVTAGSAARWSANTLTLHTSGPGSNVTAQSAIQATGSADLTIETGGTITQSAPITADLATLTATGITLAAGNDFNTLAPTTTAPGNITVNDANSINLGGVSSAGNFILTTSGAITQTLGGVVNGSTSLNSGLNPINLLAGHNFVGPVSFSGSSVALNAFIALSLGAGTTTGDLTLVSGGSITQSDLGPAGTLTVGGNTTLTPFSSTVGLANPANDFTGFVAVNSAAATTIADANALNIAGQQVTGLLHLLAGQGGGAGGHVTQVDPGALNVTGPVTVEVGGPSSDILLNKANPINGVIGIVGGTKVRDLKLRSTSAGASLNGLPPAPRDVAITFDNAPVQLTGSSLSGTMSVQAGGPITQTGNGLDVALGSSFGAGANSITLTNPLNDFGFPVTLNNTGANDAQIADENDLDLATGSIGRNLTATAGNRVIVGSAAMIAAGGNATLVTDNDAATAPAIGNGGVTLGLSASINPVGPLAIYTARRSQNSIAANAMLNETTFAPGTEFVDTAREVWQTRFPSGTAQSPFTIFYKDNETTPPQTTIDSGPAAGSTITNRTPTFTFSADEAGATFECAVDTAAFAPCTSPRTLAALGDGVHNFTVRATDALGNVDASPAQRSFTVDTSAPDTTLTKTPKKKVKTKKKKVRVVFEFISNQPGATFECSLDGLAYAPCTSPKSYKVGKGEHFFLLRSGDAVGNKDSTPARFDFKVKRKKR